MFTEPFDLLKLPKFSGSNHKEIPVICSGDCLFIGVSGSSVNKLSILPPQVLSAHSVAPGTSITAILVWDGEIKAYSTSERGKYFLKLLKDSGKQQQIEEEVCALYVSETGNRLVTVGKNSEIRLYNEDLVLVSDERRNSESGRVLYSCLVSDPSTTNTVFLVVSAVKSGIAFRTYYLDARGVWPATSAALETYGDVPELWSHYEDRLVAVGGDQVHIYKTQDGSLLSKFDLEDGNAVTGMVALPHNNIVTSRMNCVELIDCTFESKVAATKISGPGRLQLLAYSTATSTVIAARNTDEALIGIPATPTAGTLLESIGKGSASKANSTVISDIFGGFSEQAISIDFKTLAETQILAANSEFNAVINDLQSSIKEKNGIGFSRIVTYLKSPKLSWLEDLDRISAPEQQDLVYEECDRVVDAELVKQVCKMAFVPRFKPFLPIGVALYLLTHPLFPMGDLAFKRVLKVLEASDAMLYRQALVSLTGLSVEDLVLGMLSKDDATFLDAAMRLQEEFGPQQILRGVRNAFSSLQSMSSLSVMIERLSLYPQTLCLTAPFIDAMGLLAWDGAHVRNLREQIGKNVERLEGYATADSVIMDLFDSIGIDPADMDFSSKDIPTTAELESRIQKKTVGMSKGNVVTKYSVETLVL